MILLIDNYDSFSYNLYQLLGSLHPDVQVVRNDRITVKQIQAMHPQALVLSPGPGRPEDAGICVEAVQKLGAEIPILGVCLGHQAICEAYGATVSYAKTLMHGKQSVVRVEPESRIFAGLGPELTVGRYHSLSVMPQTLPPDLVASAVAEDGEVMAVEHRENPVCGLQFHPESILTPKGRAIVAHFLQHIAEIHE